MDLDFLRKKYPRFIYKDFDMCLTGDGLKLRFDFRIEPGIFFKPEVLIKDVTRSQLDRIGEEALKNFAFHCGLAEMPSYWKTTCSPEIIIEAGYLNGEQIKWWENLFIKGMGQFFYENKINFTSPHFVRIKMPRGRTPGKAPRFNARSKDRYLVPVAGGRDSIVGVELLKKQGKKIAAFTLNPSKEARAVIKIAGIKNTITIKRTIDPRLFQLNRKGYPNGHTPFTSVLSFAAVFCAVLFDFKHVVFSNEKSAEEGNLKYLGLKVNHQYSKSLEFEKNFRAYSKKYLAGGINYFSLLRPYFDLEISKMFCRYPEYFSNFSSCNRGKTLRQKKKWCGECPKCLFVYATLYPFLEKRQMKKIFGRNIFENEKLLKTMQDLIDPGRPKPFECVGTKKESRKALALCLAKARREGNIPYILKKIRPQLLQSGS